LNTKLATQQKELLKAQSQISQTNAAQQQQQEEEVESLQQQLLAHQ
jgi:hypothetical protein